MGDQDMATFDDADWSEDSRMDECDPGAPLALIGILIIHMRPLHISFVCKSFLMMRSIVKVLTMAWISALATPMFTSVRLLRNHMKPQRILVNPTGTFCLASFWPG